MKVVQINHVYKNGGSTGRIVYDLQRISVKQGIDAYVGFGYEYSLTNEINTFRIESIPELKINILKTRLLAKHGFYNKMETKRLLMWLDSIKPDVIHLHNIHGHYLNAEMLFNYIKLNSIPVVWTLHDCWSFTGWCAYFDFVQCEQWKTGCGNCPNRHEYPYTWFFDRSKSNYVNKKAIFTSVKKMIIVPPCRWLEGLVHQSYLSLYPTKVIYNGVDLNVFKPTQSEIRGKIGIGSRKMILSVAMGLSKRKGIEHIFKLAEMIDKSQQVIVMVGLSKDQITSLPFGIIGIERTNSPQELAAIYSAADVFINPTFEDNYPTTNLEAIACGTPVVTYRTGGSPESIYDGCGEIVDKGDLIAFFKAVERILQRGKGSQRCLEVAVEHFDKNKCFQKYIELYREIGEKK